jgi:FKBP-type peptidyl-prolyl cis-trans isomerase
MRIRITNRLSLAGTLPVLMLLASGCLTNDWEEKEQYEEKLIQEYLAANNISEDAKTEGGIYYVEKRPGNGSSPVLDDYVVLGYVGYYLDGDYIHETNYDSLKDDWGVAEIFTNFVYGPSKFRYGYSIQGINEGLSLMKEGGKSIMVIPSDKAYYDFQPLVYEIELLRVIPDPVEYEDSVLQVYRDEQGFDATTEYLYKGDTLWFKETLTPDPTDLRTVQENDTVLFRFTGRLVDGFGAEVKDDRIFDTSIGDDVEVINILFKSSGPVIRSGKMLAFPTGLIAAIDSMRAGTHATAVLPYDVAFDDDGLFDSLHGYAIVPQYQTVVYDIEVQEIRPPAGK